MIDHRARVDRHAVAIHDASAEVFIEAIARSGYCG
jgi:hypothetical protein